MNLNINRIFWGIIVLFLGLILMGLNLHWWGIEIWYSLFLYWPVLLIILGFKIIGGRNIVASFIVIIVFALLAAAFLLNIGQIREVKNEQTVSTQTITAPNPESVSNLNLNLDLGAAKIILGSSKSLSTPYTIDADGFGNLETSDQRSGGVLTTRIKEDVNNFFWQRNRKREMNLIIKENLPLSMVVNTGASQLNMDFERIKLEKISINSGATDATIKVGTLNPNVKIDISTGASSYVLSVPERFALSIINESALSDTNIKNLGLTKENNKYRSNDFEVNPQKVEITFSAGISHLEIIRY
ncbi:MAG: hypothetical protein WC107_00640 [Patescibacteria group bacterium]